MAMKQACIQISNQIPGLFGLRGVLMITSGNRVQKKLIEIVMFIVGMLMYHVNIFGKRDLDELNRKLFDLMTFINEDEEE